MLVDQRVHPFDFTREKGNIPISVAQDVFCAKGSSESKPDAGGVGKHGLLNVIYVYIYIYVCICI